jgi:hypothetical protein
MKVHLYGSTGSIEQHELIAVSNFPIAIYCDGNFYLHLANGYYSPCPFYIIPSSPGAGES